MLKHLKLLMSLLGLQMSWSANAAPPRELRIAATSVTSHFHPTLMRGNDDAYLREFIHGRILEPNENWQFSCNFCESIPAMPVVKGKPEKGVQAKVEKSLTWRIKKTAKWGNGMPITGWDVRFAFEIFQASRSIRNETNRSGIRSIIVNDQDASEFTIHLDSMTSDFLVDLDFPLLPASIEEPIWINAEKNIDKYLNASEYEKNPFSPALYCGCFIPASRQTDGVTLNINKYCSKGPQFTSIRTLVDRRSWREVMNSESVDLIPETIVSSDQLESIEPTFRTENALSEKWTLNSAADGSIEFLMFNLRNPAFADRKIRQALALAIDTKRLSEVTKSFIDPPTGLFPANFLGSSELKWPYAANVAEALTIFKQMRWLPDSKGMLQRDGKSLSFEMVISAQPQSKQKTADELIAMFKAVGVALRIKVVDDQVFRSNIFARSNFSDLIMLRWNFEPGLIPFSMLHSSQIPGVENDYRGQNISGIFSKKIDDQLVRWAGESDPQQQILIRQEIHRLFAEDIYAIPLLQRRRAAFSSKQLKGFRLSSHSRPSSSLMSNWQF